MAKDVLFKTDGTEMNVQPKNGKDYKLAELHGFVGGYIEIVTVPALQGLIFVVNEEGAINGSDFNRKASAIAGMGLFGDILMCSSDRVK